MAHDRRIVLTESGPTLSRLAAMVGALDITLDRQQWFAVLEASKGREAA
jgi:predicted oxidoreductase